MAGHRARWLRRATAPLRTLEQKIRRTLEQNRTGQNKAQQNKARIENDIETEVEVEIAIDIGIELN